VRLGTFGLLVLVAVFAWLEVLSAFWLILPVVGLAVLIQRHDRVIRARDATARAIAFYERGLARIEDRWVGGGSSGDRFADDRHLYANDLDLFGRGSLFELLSIARTRSGEDVLAAWLKTAGRPAGDRRTATVDHRAHVLARVSGIDRGRRIRHGGAAQRLVGGMG
jgi:hypothetical protein